MSDKSFDEYRTEEIKEEDDNMEVEDPVIERKWYKHVYKSSHRKGNFRQYKSSQIQGYSQQKKENRVKYDKEDRKPILDLRTRTIDHNRRDGQLQKGYMA